MKTLVLDPDIVRAVLDPNEFPRRCVWMVTVRGEIIVNDLDEGWMRFCPDSTVSDRRWAVAIKAAVRNLQSKLESSLAIYYRFLETTDPAIPQSIERHTVHVKKAMNFGTPLIDSRSAVSLANVKCIECGMSVISKDHTPFCGPDCQAEVVKDGTKVNWPLPPEILELRKKAQEEDQAKGKDQEPTDPKTDPFGKMPH